MRYPDSSMKWHCRTCEMFKVPAVTVPDQVTPTPFLPWNTVSADLIGPVPGPWPYALCCIDNLTKFAVAIRLKSTSEMDYAFDLVEEVCFKYGIPEHLICDNGPTNFAAEVGKQIHILLGISQHFVAVHAPWANGEVERFNKL